MKDKIINAIDKGLMNVLSTDINDSDIDFEHDDISNEFIKYEYKTVDMGTNVLWCEYNLGAYPGSNAEAWYGDYYRWGDTEAYSDGPYKYQWYDNNDMDTITEFHEDNSKKLMSAYDVVSQTLWNGYMMPTQKDYCELIFETTQEWVKNYNGITGLNGMIFIAKNGNILFFPAAGYYHDSDHYCKGTTGYIWASTYDTLLPAYANMLDITSVGNPGTASDRRSNGLSVRGIRNKI